MVERFEGDRSEDSGPIAVAAGGPSLTVERGPDWLFVRFDGPKNPVRGRVAETIWGMLRENMTNRVVLEMESVGSMDEHLLGEIVQLGRRVRAEGGVIRISGLSDENLSRLQASPAADDVPCFPSRTDAVRAARAAII